MWLSNKDKVLFALLRASLWDTHKDYSKVALQHAHIQALTKIARQQAVAGLIAHALIDTGVKMEHKDIMDVYNMQRSIQLKNEQIDDAVVELCQIMEREGIRIIVFKGQTVGALYPDHSLRQSGDIDFYCCHDDWKKAIHYFRDKEGLKIDDMGSSKDVSFQRNNIIYEMHNQLTSFNYPMHNRYWKRVVMPEILSHPYTVRVKEYDVPTLAPTYNALFVFAHIFRHLILEGIALRQFCDWARVLDVQHDEIDVALLERHLCGLGLHKAYCGLGAMLTKLLGLQSEKFPFAISEDDEKRLPALWENMLQRGNFGKSVRYRTKNIITHSIEHIWQMSKQAREFHHYAPAEAWWHIPALVGWWVLKSWRWMTNTLRPKHH